MPGSGVISCSGPACAKTRPVRALNNPDGRHTYVGRFVRSAAYAYKIISLYGSFFPVQRLHGFRQVVQHVQLHVANWVAKVNYRIHMAVR